jgi:hypothetical protein
MRPFAAISCRPEAPRFAMQRQLEAIGQQRLQHQPHLRAIRLALGLGLDIEAIRSHPGRTADSWYALHATQPE